MSTDKTTSNTPAIYGAFWLLMAIATAMIGHRVNDSLFWAIVDFFFWPLAWAKWLICQQVNISIIRETFAFFLR